MEIISLILNVIFGGTLIGALVTLATLKSQVRKSKAEAEAKILENWQTYIGDPLKKEIKSLRNEVSKFRKAVDKISGCIYADDCPVRNELQNTAGDTTDNQP